MLHAVISYEVEDEKLHLKHFMTDISESNSFSRQAALLRFRIDDLSLKRELILLPPCSTVNSSPTVKTL